MRQQIFIKTGDQIAKMRTSGQLAAQVLEMIEPHVTPGITTGALNDICHDYMVNVQHTIPATLGYHGFTKSICTSVNQVVCHGIPGNQILQEGDIINIDVTVIKDGYHGDTSKMFYVGKVSEPLQKLCEITQKCMYLGIQEAWPGKTLGDVGFAIEQLAHKNFYSIVEEYCGHGIGQNFHEAPQVLHFGKKNTGIILREGMCFTVEPMLNIGKRHVKVLSDKWTVVTKDNKPSAQWEHTILVTKEGPEILTLRKEEQAALSK